MHDGRVEHPFETRGVVAEEVDRQQEGIRRSGAGCHTPPIGSSRQGEPYDHGDREHVMADQPLLEVNCTNCPGNQACEDCVVHFFLAERVSAVVSLDRRAAARRPSGTVASSRPSGPAAALPPDLAAALALLEAAGMGPEVLSVEPLDAARAS
jgi:hypothetical protein